MNGGGQTGVPHPMGVNVSNPFTADHGSPFFLTSSCIFLAVMSMARANRYSRLVSIGMTWQ